MAYKEIAEVVLKCNSEDYKRTYEDNIAKAKALRKALADAYSAGDARKVIEVNKELQKTNATIQRMRTNASNVEAAMRNLDKATPKELHRALKAINAELSSGRVERGSKDWDAYIDKLKAVKRQLSEVNAEMSIDTRSPLEKLKDGINDWGASAATAVAAFGGVVVSGKAAVQAYADMEAEMANVRKYTGMTAEQVENLNEAFKQMDTRTSREGLNKLAQEAGRLGKTSIDDVLGFVKAADQINVALDELGEGATLTLSKLTGIFGLEGQYGTEQSLLKVGSVVNELSQNCAASAPYLTEFASRMAGVGAQAGLSVQQIMAFGAVLDSTNQNVEASATALSQVIVRIYQDPAKYAKIAGLDIQNFTSLVKTDINSALMELLSALNQVGGMDALSPMFKDMGENGARAIATLSTLAEHIEDVKQQQVAANTAFAEGSSVTKEFDVQNNTVQARLDKLKKSFTEMAVSLGEKLLPVMQYAISGTSLLMHALSSVVGFIVKNRTAVISLVAAITVAVLANNSYVIWAKLCAAAEVAHTIAIKAKQIVVTALTNLMTGLRLAYYAMTLQVGKLTVAWKALDKATKANVFGAIASAAIMLYGVIKNLISGTDEYTQKMDKAMASANGLSAESIKEEKELSKLFSTLKGTTAGTDAYEKAKAAIISQYGQYLQGLVNEKGEIIDLEAAYKRLTIAIRANAKAKGIATARENIETTYNEEVTKDLEELRKSLTAAGATKSQIEKVMTAVQDQITTNRPIGKEIQGLLDRLYEQNVQSSNQAVGLIAISPAAGLVSSYNAGKAQQESPLGIFNRITKRQGDYLSRMVSLDQMEGIARPAKNASDEDLATVIKMLEGALKRGEYMSTVAVIAPNGSTTLDIKTRAEIQDLLDQYRIEQGNRVPSGNSTQNPSPTIEPTRTVPTSDGVKGANKEDTQRERQKQMQAEIDAVKAQNDAIALANLTAYATGQKDFEQYLYTKRNLEEQAREAQIKIYEEWGETDNAKYRDLLKKRAEADLDAIAARKKQMASLIDSEHRERTDNITMRYYDPTAAEFDNKVALNQALLEEDIRYLRQKQLLYEQNSEEYAAIEKQIQTRVNQDKLDKQKELADAYKQIVGKYLETSAEATKQAELKMLDKLLEAGVITQEQFEEIKTAIEENADAAEAAGKGFAQFSSEMGQNVSTIYNAIKQIAEGAKDIPGYVASAITSAIALLSTFLQQTSAYYDAERDLELAKVEKRYDAEIKAAGKNERKKKKIEEQKERETAKIKNKYNKRAQSMELAQAVASTAMAAINAYASASKVNWILGPIAAAMAVAAGAIQIATIQKQHQAQAAGYYSGGFTTRSSNNRREVGVVHANEFVANHQAVANPAIAPVLRLIDQAQRANTVGSLTANDVSNAIGVNRGVSTRGVTSSESATATINDSAAIIADISARTSKALDRLSDNIEQGILAEVVMDGERGLARKLNNYNKLNQNVRR
jgi:TP901 family phage tail tape measure protein